ncbi:MAG: hypothetical protein Kow0063_29930 [Anaerolineae bacterium]
MRRRVRRSLEMRYLKRLPTLLVLALVLLLSLALGYVWTGFIFPLVLRLSPVPLAGWAALEGLSSAAAFAFTVGAGLIVLMQLAETADSRNLDIYRDIYEKLMSEEEIEARRFIYQQIPASEDDQVVIDAILNSDSARKYVKQVLNLIDYFGFLVEQDWVTADEIIGWISPVVVKVWEKIGPVVEYERSRRPEEPDYYEAAFKLAERCRKWRDRNLPGRRVEISFDSKRL